MVRICSIIFLVLLGSLSTSAQEWIWGRGSIGNNVSSWPVAADRLGNVYVTGVSSGAVSFTNSALPFSATGNLAVVAKYTKSGAFLWARNSESGTSAYPIDMAIDSAGNCYLLGWSPGSDIAIGEHVLHNANHPHIQYFIAKFNALGDVLWIKYAGSRTTSRSTLAVSLSASGGATIRRLGGITAAADGRIYYAVPFNERAITLGPTTVANADPFERTDDLLVASLDTGGNVQWAASSGGSGDDIPGSIAVTPAGSVYVAGVFNSDSIRFGPYVIADTSTGSQRWNAFVARYDNGTAVWASGSNSGGSTYATGVAADTAGNIYLVGGSADSAINITGTPIITPYAATSFLYLVKLDTANHASWYTTIGSPHGGITCGYSVATAPGGSVWVSGFFTEKIIVQGRDVEVPDGGVDPAFIAGYTPEGYYIGSGTLQSGGSRQSGITCDPDGSVYLCSDYKYPCAPFIIANNVLATVTAGESWLYLAKYIFKGGAGPGSGPSVHIKRREVVACLENNTVVLKGPAGHTLYRWNDGSSDSELHVTTPGIYYVKAMGLSDTAAIDTFLVRADGTLCDCEAFLPNAFSPNGDRNNDIYRPLFKPGCLISRYAFSIYNRWGERVFYTENPYEYWDGSYKNEKADMGVFMFYLTYAVNPDYPVRTKKGDLTLVR
ncbi:MAG: gliding motility-associated C-terminal domain-containing protein [Bacteroidota bacterium]